MTEARTLSSDELQLVTASRPAYEAYRILYIGFIVVPLLAGLDKFTHILADWDQYLAPVVSRLLPVSGHTFMLCVGIVEVAAAVLVALRPRLGGYVVAAWLCGTILNHLLIPGYFDMALRDLGLALGALALARLSTEFDGVSGLTRGPSIIHARLGWPRRRDSNPTICAKAIVDSTD